MDYFIVLTMPDGDGWRAWCPDLPGWTATGESAGEAQSLAQEIVVAVVAGRRAAGFRVCPAAVASTVAMPEQTGPLATAVDLFAYPDPPAGDGPPARIHTA